MAADFAQTRYPGIYQRHRVACRRRKECGCPYIATVYSAREKKQIRKQFARIGEARTWQEDAKVAVRGGKLRSPTRTTVAEAGRELTAGMQDGSIFDRSGNAYKPSTRRGYERALRLHVEPVLGHLRLSALDRGHVQGLVERLHGQGLAPSTIQNALNPLQVICRRAVHSHRLAVDPTDGLELPAVRGRRDRIEAPEHARVLIEALPEPQRGFWAAAFYAGLRRGELRALRWSDVDFERKLVRVERAWDDQEGIIEVKSQAGRRSVPMAAPLRAELRRHKMRSGRHGDDLVFGRTATLPFVPSTVRRHAREAWEAAGLEPLSPHEARHCAASYLIAAGLNAKELSTYIGHSDIRVTYNRYGHLMPGGEEAAADRLSTFLDGEIAVKVP